MTTDVKRAEGGISMRVLIVFESMYGNTHVIADRIGEGLGSQHEVRVVPVSEATPDAVIWADLLIAGGPTHVHTLSRQSTRNTARGAAAKAGSHLRMDPDAGGPGLRDWVDGIGPLHGKDAAAFDTRLDAPAMFTGRASKRIDHQLRERGATVISDPESFLVDKLNRLIGDEPERAVRWGQSLTHKLLDVRGSPAPVR